MVDVKDKSILIQRLGALILVIWLIIGWFAPSVHAQAEGPIQNQAVKNVSAVQQLGGGEVIITYDLLAPEGQPMTVRFEYRERKTRDWQPMMAVTSVGALKPNTGLTATWQAASDADLVNTNSAQVRVVARSLDGRAVMAVSPPFKLDTLPPLGCSCGYPGYEDKNIPLDVSLLATVPTDSSPPFEYRFRLGLAGEEEPLVVTNWVTEPEWTPGFLKPGTGYWWAVEARDVYSNSAGWSFPVRFTTVSTKLTSVVETPTAGTSRTETPSATTTGQSGVPSASAATADARWPALVLGLVGLGTPGLCLAAVAVMSNCCCRQGIGCDCYLMRCRSY